MATYATIAIDSNVPGWGGPIPNKVSIIAEAQVVVDGKLINGIGLGEGEVITEGTNTGVTVSLRRDSFEKYSVIVGGVSSDSGTPPSLAETQITTFPNYLIWPSGEGQTPQQITSNHEDNATDAAAANIVILRTHASVVHHGLVALLQHLETIKGFYDHDDVVKAEQYITYLHRGMQAVVRRLSTTGNTLQNISIADRIKFSQETLKATLDITVPASPDQNVRLNAIAKGYFSLVEADRLAHPQLTDREIGTPTHAVVVYDWRNGQHVNLKDVIAFSGAGSNAAHQFTHANGTTVDALRLDTGDAASITGDPDGSWLKLVNS